MRSSVHGCSAMQGCREAPRQWILALLSQVSHPICSCTLGASTFELPWSHRWDLQSPVLHHQLSASVSPMSAAVPWSHILAITSCRDSLLGPSPSENTLPSVRAAVASRSGTKRYFGSRRRGQRARTPCDPHPWDKLGNRHPPAANCFGMPFGVLAVRWLHLAQGGHDACRTRLTSLVSVLALSRRRE